ncbi:MAG: hypothetical protein AAFP77_12730 [Bacteroidota bacterium]
MAIPSVKKVQELTGHNGAIYALAPGPEPNTFLSAGGDGWIVQWSFKEKDEQGALLGRLVAKVDTQVFSIAYIPTTDTVVAGDMNGGVHWLNLKEDRPNRHLAHHKKGTFGFHLLDDELFSIGGDGIITRWDILRQSSSESLHLSSQALRSIIGLDAQGELLVGSSDHNIYRIGIADLDLRETVKAAHDNSVFALHVSDSNPAMLYSGGRDAHLRQWSVGTTLTQKEAQPAHWFTINHLIADPTGTLLFSASRDKTIRIWDRRSFTLRKTLDAARDGGHVNSVNRLLWIEGTSYFVSASDDRVMIVWEVG